MVTAMLVLASTSTARARLLRSAGLDPVLVPSTVDEAEVKASLRAAGASVAETVATLAELKAHGGSRRFPEALVIGADLILECDGEWFDKPADHAAARRHLQQLRGREHRLVGCVSVVRAGMQLWHHADVARLSMRQLSDGFIDAYLAAVGDAALRSVGAYEIEGIGVQLFDRIAGDYFTIQGLPLLPLLAFLRMHGVVPT